MAASLLLLARIVHKFMFFYIISHTCIYTYTKVAACKELVALGTNCTHIHIFICTSHIHTYVYTYTRVAACKELVALGANLCATNYKGQTPSMLAKNNINFHQGMVFRNAEEREYDAKVCALE
jgi:hypothetical protein